MLFRSVAAALHGSGGGRKDFAQGGGDIPSDMAAFEKQLAELAKKAHLTEFGYNISVAAGLGTRP